MKRSYKILAILITLALLLVAIPALAVELGFGSEGPGLHETELIAG